MVKDNIKQIKIPDFPESVTEGTLLTWYKKVGDFVAQDEKLLDVETDKIILEVAAPESGVIKSISARENDIVISAQIVGSLEVGAQASTDKTVASSADKVVTSDVSLSASSVKKLSPAARNLIAEHKLDGSAIAASGDKNTVTKEDVGAHLAKNNKSSNSSNNKSSLAAASATSAPTEINQDARYEERVAMRGLRANIAKRLVQAQQTAAILTTFNEVNMEPLMTLRKKYKEEFADKKAGAKLGFMSFFTKAAVNALKAFPEVNAAIDGNEIVYHGYQDIGIAVSSPRGLVVPIVRNAELMSIAQIESSIAQYAQKARDNSLALEDITGGTFTISNGGVFGSLLSTPIINPPQTAILGMHAIQQRPIAVGGEVVIKPMMYLALSYDHRLIDGRQAVQFLITIKNCIEDPARMLLEI